MKENLGIAKTCQTMEELRHKVALYYGKEDIQLSMGDVVPPEK